MAQNKLKFAPTSNAFNTTLNGAINSTDTTINLNSVSGLQNKPGILVIDRVDSSGIATASSREYIYFTSVAGSAVVLPNTSDGRGQGGSSAQSHADGAVVEAIIDVDQWNGLVDSYDAQHNDSGTHTAVTTDTLSATSLVSISSNLFTNTLNVASTASVSGRLDVANINLPSTASGFYQAGRPVIQANASDQTVIGRNSVRPTRRVVINNPTLSVNADPANTNWSTVDVTAITSARCFAIHGYVQIVGTGTNESLFIVATGDTQVQDATTRRVTVQVSGITNNAGFTCAVSTGQQFDWSVSNSNVSAVGIRIDAYEEYLD